MSFLDDGAVARLRALAEAPADGEIVGGRFELRAPIGEGGMGVVWSAWDREAGREVAVKVLRDADDEARARFAREAAALEGLAHAAVARPIAHGETASGAPFLAMERLSGRSLADRLAQGPLGVRASVTLGRAAATALAAVHAAGLVHRDVKPGNLFLVRGDPADLRLLDFGLARGKDGLRLTRTGALLGTPGYMAPEQVRGDPAVGAAADVFALGAVLFECVAGRAAFWAEDAERALTKILLEAPPLLRTIRPATPLALEGLIEAMLDKDAAQRPDAATVARELATIEAAIGDEDEATRLPVGALIGGKYRVEGTIGEGGMGVILAAVHEELARPVALKLLRARSPEDEARLLREARALSRLEGEHVARVLDVGRLEDGAPYLVIERLDGADLARVLRERGPLPIADAVRWAREACEAIAEAHALGIVHRDLKPSNLFVARRRDGSKCLKVLDFGISKVERATADERTLTAPSAVMGSAWYMSPEQLAGAKDVDARADVWALGVVLHELCAGAPPFDAATAAAVGARIAAGEPARLRDARPDAPAALEDVILRCLAKDRAARIQTVTDLSRALAAIAEDAPAASAAPPRSPRRATIVGAATISFALLAAAAILGRAPAPPPVASPSPPPPPSAEPSPPPAITAAPTPTASATVVTTAVPAAPAPSARPAANRKPPRHAASAAPSAARPPKAALHPPPTIDVRDPVLDGR